ncbi:MAG: DUF1569 domain-containing protein [Gemmatimonadaceae bacterium]|nr:DUF1569 domain-containing protein [Gemmatimonadaceae bacterium]
MPSIFDPAAAAALDARIAALTPATTARWGKFDAPKMVAHLTEALRMALGDIVVRARASGLLRTRLVRYLIIHVVPFPKGAPTAPALLARASTSWDADIAELRALVRRAQGEMKRTSWPAHPAFGALSAHDWGVLIHKHVAHHLTQFGV